ncbi:DUF5131 family protein [Rhodococcoides fascians]|uniref:DUF5131 family protein n=1 Tax=Rhodococcoides fascians TaxID=1828 RepID=UPI00050CF237|nr:phage Gp37/Gp68 family protein [Rhodococcus fascians]
MGDKTGIEWTDATWNPVTGCTKVSPGCDHCYAESIAHRFAGTKSYPNGFDVTLHPGRLTQPLRWRKPRRVFVNSMSDLFHKDISDDYIARVFGVMAANRWHSAPTHTFQVLTKRPARMRTLLSSANFRADVASAAATMTDDAHCDNVHDAVLFHEWPLSNVWLGVSTENQKWTDIRLPQLLATPAVRRFISAEPLLGPIDLTRYAWLTDKTMTDFQPMMPTGLDWVIVGGESGHGARPMHPDWVRSLRNQCVRDDVSFHFKQWGEWGPLAPLRADGSADYSRTHTIATDGTLYAPGDLVYPDGPRYGEAIRAGHSQDHLCTTFRVGKKAAGRELDGRTWNEQPIITEAL